MNDRRSEGCSIDHILHIASLPGIELERERGIASDHEIWTHTRPLSWYDTDQLDFIGRFERLHEDWAIIANAIGIADELPHCNRSPSKTPLSIDDMRAIATIYKEDFERFGYGP